MVTRNRHGPFSPTLKSTLSKSLRRVSGRLGSSHWLGLGRSGCLSWHDACGPLRWLRRQRLGQRGSSCCKIWINGR